MALMTKGQIRTAVRSAIDDPKGGRWTDTELDMLISLVQDNMFEPMLDTYEYLTMQIQESQGTDASGAVALSALTKRMYRLFIVSLSSSGIDYQAAKPNETYPQPTYSVIGGKILTMPPAVSTSVKVTYSYLPTKFKDLANDATLLAVEYPEGHETALIYLTAAFALTKGGAEDMTQIASLADNALEALLVHIARLLPIGTQSRVAQTKMAIMRNMLLSQAKEQ